MKFSARYVFIAVLALQNGCATWMPSGEQPPAIETRIRTPPLGSESVAIDSFLLRVQSEDSIKLEQLWSQIDQQIVAPELRLELHKNGMRVGKISSSLPSILESWVRDTERRREEDAFEMAGLVADVKSEAVLWRCKASSIKEISIRNLSSQTIPLFYHVDGLKGKSLFSPRFYYSMSAIPGTDHTADVKLVPEIEHGEFTNKLIVRDAALRQVPEREKLNFVPLKVQLKMHRGDTLVIGPTQERKALGAEFLHSLTQENIHEPVLLLLRLSNSGVDSNFAPNDASQSQPGA
jgi:hypothetical protein